MKKIGLLIIILLIALLSGRMIMQSTKEVPPKAPVSAKTDQSRVFPSPTVMETQGIPEKITIKSIKVEADVESVGMDSLGRMDVPKDDFNVAWYNLGFKPGENGSAVIAGHFDSRTGGPAVFYKLSELKDGDIITVEYANGNSFDFSVVDKKEYDFDKVPLQEVFNSTDKPRLNLITCDGVFNSRSKNYSKRLVVFAELNS